MNPKLKVTLLALSVALSGTVSADAIEDLNLGLSKTSVFDTPTPEPYVYGKIKAGKSTNHERYWSGQPPIIPHVVEKYLPITASKNKCLKCHEEPELIGQNSDESPMPKSHYRDTRSDSDAMTDEVRGARYTCVQCHVPQTGAAPLVANTLEN